jgi:hypothetical protein
MHFEVSVFTEGLFSVRCCSDDCLRCPLVHVWINCRSRKSAMLMTYLVT